MKKTILALLLISLCLSTLTGCGKETMSLKDAADRLEEVWPDEQKKPEDSQEAEKPEGNPSEVQDGTADGAETTEAETASNEEAASTGELAVTSSGNAKAPSVTRPYAFVCNNNPVAMPLVGIGESGLIMEMIGSGGVTHFLCFMTDPSKVETVGSIGPAETCDVECCLGFDGILVHNGGSEKANAMIDSNGAADIDGKDGPYGPGTLFFDESRQDHGQEYSMFASGAKCVSSAVEVLSYRTAHKDDYDGTRGMICSDMASALCTEEAIDISVIYSSGKTSDFTYEDENEGYLMSQYGDTLKDDEGNDITFANVLMLYAKTWLQEDGSVEVEITEGDGYFFCGGKAVEIHWYKEDIFDSFRFELMDGTAIALAPGKTFICVNQSGGFDGTCEFY